MVSCIKMPLYFYTSIQLMTPHTEVYLKQNERDAFNVSKAGGSIFHLRQSEMRIYLYSDNLI